MDFKVIERSEREINVALKAGYFSELPPGRARANSWAMGAMGAMGAMV